MKGDRGEPRCGFSRKVVEALNGTGVEYSTFDILQDEDVRQGLKTFSNWPTYPQLYAGGELLGGCDIVLEMAAGGELKAALEEAMAAAKPEEDINAKLAKLVKSSKVVLFMKGDRASRGAVQPRSRPSTTRAWSTRRSTSCRTEKAGA